MRARAIFLTPRLGDDLQACRTDPRLGHVLIHELVHATQRERRAWNHPPYDQRAMAVDRQILEGMTERFTQHIMRDARANWTGHGQNPYTQREFRKSLYNGYVFVIESAMRVAQPDGLGAAFWRELSHNPHKLTMFTELLVGRYTPECKARLAEVFGELFALSESMLATPRELETTLSPLADKRFQEYRTAQRAGA